MATLDAIPLIGILVVPDRVYFSVGLGMILVVTTAVVASLTPLPAILSLMGDGVNRFSESRWSAANTHSPWTVQAASGTGSPLRSCADPSSAWC